ncbi:1,2-diacylglycerol 3-alpha-glucosyltransferase [Candidatus Hakubella thermalkaliphila]|nr:1,2-diacylglycerol 3-alpha-glucosyltransferase [Candidatus Hakubella thermalkaliphila]
MKIGMFTDTYSPQINGVVTSIISFENELMRQGHEVHIFAPRFPGYKDDGNHIHRFPSVDIFFIEGYRLAIPTLWEIMATIRKLKLDIVHSHDPFPLGLVALRVSRAESIPLVHTYHTLYEEYLHYLPRIIRLRKKRVERISRIYCDRCDLVLSPSERIRELLIKYGVGSRIEVLPTGVDLHEFESLLPGEEEEAQEKKNKDIRLIYVGRVAKEKNIEFLFDVMDKVRSRVPRVVLRVVGGGPELPHLKRVCQESELADIVSFSGFVDRKGVVKELRQSDIFVFSSLTETQGLAILEAMATGLPVVAVDAMGASQLIEHGREGFLTGLDVDQFVDHVLKLIRNPSLRQEMGRLARDKATANSLTHVTGRLLDLYGECIDAAGDRRKNVPRRMVRARSLAETGKGFSKIIWS